MRIPTLSFECSFTALAANVFCDHGKKLEQSIHTLFLPLEGHGGCAAYSMPDAEISMLHTCLAWEMGLLKRLRACVMDPGKHGLSVTGRATALGCMACILNKPSMRMAMSKVRGCALYVRAFVRGWVGGWVRGERGGG